MLVRLLVESDMFCVFPYYGLEKEKKIFNIIVIFENRCKQTQRVYHDFGCAGSLSLQLY